MEILVLFWIASLIIFVGFLGEMIFRRTNIPDIVWLLIGGMTLSILFPELRENQILSSIAPIFTTFALVFILFEGASNLDFRHLVRGFVSGVNLTFANFLLSTITVTIVLMAFGWDMLSGLLLGSILGGTSSAVVMPIVRRISIHKIPATVLTLESALSDVICIVAAISVINIIKVHEFDALMMLWDVMGMFLIATILGALGGLAWVSLQAYLNKVSRSYMITIAFLLVLYTIAEFAGGSGAIASLVFGVVLGYFHKLRGHDFMMRKDERFFYSEMTFFLKSFFYVYLGMLMDFSDLMMIIVGLVISVSLLLVRPLAVYLAVGHRGADKDRAFMEVIIPKGLAAAVLAQLAVQESVVDAHSFSTVVVSVILFTILFSSTLVFLTEKGYFKGMKGIFRH